MALPQTYLSFAEVVRGRKAEVRLSPEGLLSAVDFVMVMTGHDVNISNQHLHRIKPSVFSQDQFVIKARHKWVTPEVALKLAKVIKPDVSPELREPIAQVVKTLLPAGAEVEEVQAPTEVAMPFDAIMEGATVRFTTINGVQYLSVRDLIKVICDPGEHNSMRPWERLSESQKSELQPFWVEFVFPGRGTHDPKVITFPGALKLVMWLGGENAKDFRTKVVGILTRYFAGDPSLLQDIQANAQSDSPINQFARASLQSESGDGIEPASKRQRIDPYTEEELVRFERFDKVASRFEHHNGHFREHVSLVKEEVEVHVWKESEMVRLAAQREQDAIKAARERAELEASVEKDRLKFRQANYNLGLLEAQAARDSRKDELLHSQAMKQVQAQPVQPTAQDGGVGPGPASTTTVLKVYHAHKAAFSMLPREQTRAFFIKAGHLAKQAYVAQFGLQPERAMEQGFSVNVYPSFAEPLILTALRGALRDITAGGNQPPLRFSVVVPGMY